MIKPLYIFLFNIFLFIIVFLTKNTKSFSYNNIFNLFETDNEYDNINDILNIFKTNNKYDDINDIFNSLEIYNEYDNVNVNSIRDAVIKMLIEQEENEFINKITLPVSYSIIFNFNFNIHSFF